MIVAKGRVRHHQGLDRHGVAFHVVADAGAGVDDDFIGQARIALAVHRFLADETLAEGPMAVHQRHPVGGIGIKHLLGGNDFDLVRVDLEAKIIESDFLDRLIDPLHGFEVPVRTFEEWLDAGAVDLGHGAVLSPARRP